MTIPVSTTTDNSFVKNYTRYRFGENKSPLIAYIIFNILSYPLFFFLLLIYATNENAFHMDNTSDYIFAAGALVSMMAIGAIAVFPIIFAFRNFRYLHDKTLTDMSFSLPITRAGRFWSDYLSGLFSLVVPYIISSAVGMILFGIAQGLHSDVLGSVKTELSISPDLSLAAFQLMLAGLIYLVVTYSITVLASALSGQQKGATGLGFFFLLGVPAVVGLLLAAFFHYDNYGLVLTKFTSQLLAAINPFAFVSLSIPSVCTTELGFGVFVPQVIIPILAIAALCTVGAYLVCKSRKVEKIGTAIINKPLSVAISAAVVFLATGFFWLVGIDSNDEFKITTWIFVFIVAVIITVISEIKHGAKKIGIELLKLIGYVGGSILIIFLCTLTRSFGMGSYVPAVSEVKFVESDVFTTDVLPNSYLINSEHLQFFRYGSPESIEAFTKIQQNSIDSKILGTYNDTLLSTRGSFNYIFNHAYTLKYHMNDGSVVVRQYNLNNSNVALLAPVFGDAEQRASLFEKIESEMKNDTAEVQLSNIADEHNTKIEKEFHQKLFEAIKKDYTALTYKQLYEDDSEIIAALKFLPSPEESSSGFCFYLKSYYTETLSVLNEIGYSDLSRYSADYIDDIPEIWKSSFYMVSSYSYDSSTSFTLNPADPEVKALLKKVQATYMTVDSGYTIHFGGYSFVVPKPYIDDAKKLYDAKELAKNDIAPDEIANWLWRNDFYAIKRLGLSCTEKAVDESYWYYSEDLADYKKSATERLTKNVSPITDVFGDEINIWLNLGGELPEDIASTLEGVGFDVNNYESNLIENQDADTFGVIFDHDLSLPRIIFVKGTVDEYDHLFSWGGYTMKQYMELYALPNGGFTVLTCKDGDCLDQFSVESDDMLETAIEYIRDNLQ